MDLDLHDPASARIETRHVEPRSPNPLAGDARPVDARLVSSLLLLLGIGLFLALPFVLSVGSVVFLPLVTAIIFTIVLSPFADRLIRLGLPNLVASAISVVAMIVAVVLALLVIIQPAYD